MKVHPSCLPQPFLTLGRRMDANLRVRVVNDRVSYYDILWETLFNNSSVNDL